MTVENYLAAEQPIIDRIRDRIDAFKVVKSFAFLDGDDPDAAGDPLPACYVRYLRDVLASEGAATDQYTLQLWDIIIATQNYRDVRNGQEARLEAGSLFRQVVLILNRWQPLPEFRLMKRVSTDFDAYTSNGCAFHFLRYQTGFDENLPRKAAN